jgi:hypothetical protein
MGLEGYRMRNSNATPKRLDFQEEDGKVMLDGGLMSTLVEGTN